MPESQKILHLDRMVLVDRAADGPADEDAAEQSIMSDEDARAALSLLMHILSETQTDPVAQLSGFLMSDDPGYLPEDTEARALVRRVGRDRLLETLIGLYMEEHVLTEEKERNPDP